MAKKRKTERRGRTTRRGKTARGRTTRKGRTAGGKTGRKSSKKGASPYNKFVKKMSPILRKQNPDMAQPQIMKLIAKEWNAQGKKKTGGKNKVVLTAGSYWSGCLCDQQGSLGAQSHGAHHADQCPMYEAPASAQSPPAAKRKKKWSLPSLRGKK